ncbi:MAG: hypothetical protein FVQ83_13635 [Chloroflexi bacterium]|nr:hypothetical protein [Chloroflexota bacterium]
MSTYTDKQNSTPIRLRKIAKIWGLISIGLLTVLLIGEMVSPHAGEEQVPFIEWVMLFLFPFATVLGMAIAWRWEALGGIISTASFVIFIVLLTADRGELIAWPGLAMMLLIAMPGFLFLACWYISRGEQQTVETGEF